MLLYKKLLLMTFGTTLVYLSTVSSFGSLLSPFSIFLLIIFHLLFSLFYIPSFPLSHTPLFTLCLLLRIHFHSSSYLSSIHAFPFAFFSMFFSSNISPSRTKFYLAVKRLLSNSHITHHNAM